jgi:hypothetical protein
LSPSRCSKQHILGAGPTQHPPDAPASGGMTDLEAIADPCHLLEGQQEHVAYHAALDLYLERHL